jgi:hypothetical protein
MSSPGAATGISTPRRPAAPGWPPLFYREVEKAGPLGTLSNAFNLRLATGRSILTDRR